MQGAGGGGWGKDMIWFVSSAQVMTPQKVAEHWRLLLLCATENGTESGLITMQRMYHEWAWGLKRVVLSPVHSGSDALSGCQLVARRHSGCLGEPLVYLPPGHVSINDILHSLVVSSVWNVITGLIHFTLPAVISPLVAPSCQNHSLSVVSGHHVYKDLVKV